MPLPPLPLANSLKFVVVLGQPGAEGCLHRPALTADSAEEDGRRHWGQEGVVDEAGKLH